MSPRKSSDADPELPEPVRPTRTYHYFCGLMRRLPGELNLKTQIEFNALVGQFFVTPMRDKYLATKWRSVSRGWDAAIEEQLKKPDDKIARRTYVRRRRKSVADDLLRLLGRLYWNYAAWIILHGEYKAMINKKTQSRFEERLRGCYGYLPQLEREDWFWDVAHGKPLDLAYRDTAEWFGLKDTDKTTAGEMLHRLLLPKRLRKTLPAPLVRANMDSRKLLSRLLRIPPPDRTRKQEAQIRVIQAEVRWEPEAASRVLPPRDRHR